MGLKRATELVKSKIETLERQSEGHAYDETCPKRSLSERLSASVQKSVIAEKLFTLDEILTSINEEE